jgi:hypothetical protein
MLISVQSYPFLRYPVPVPDYRILNDEERHLSSQAHTSTSCPHNVLDIGQRELFPDPNPRMDSDLERKRKTKVINKIRKN